MPNPDHIILFQHKNFRGQHRHIFDAENNLNDSDDKTLNDQVSSFVVLSGCWTFFRDRDFQNGFRGEFGPGKYAFVEDSGIANDSISSLRSSAGEDAASTQQEAQESSA